MQVQPPGSQPCKQGLKGCHSLHPGHCCLRWGLHPASWAGGWGHGVAPASARGVQTFFPLGHGKLLYEAAAPQSPDVTRACMLVEFVLYKHFGKEKQNGKITAMPDGLVERSTYLTLHIFKVLQETSTN